MRMRLDFSVARREPEDKGEPIAAEGAMDRLLQSVEK